MIYVATPYSHPNKEICRQRFENVSKYCASLLAQGINVFSPISHSHPIAKFSEGDISWKYWEKFDKEYIDKCDELYVYMQNGWMESVGVQEEIRYATKLGKKVSYIVPSPDVLKMSESNKDVFENAINDTKTVTNKESTPDGIAQHEKGAKLDKGKIRPDLVLGGFARALWEVCRIGTYGANKYTDDGWKYVEDGSDRYSNAQMRHWLKNKMGQLTDTEFTDILHMTQECWNSLCKLELFLIELEKNGEWSADGGLKLKNDGEI